MERVGDDGQMHDHQHHSDATVSSLKLAFFLNVGFTLVEIAGGAFTNSVAILADAVHDLGDSLSLGLAWWLEVISKRKAANDTFTYGYQRVSLLSSLINAVVLTAGSTLVLAHAVPRLFAPEIGNATGMIGFAVLGIIVNGWAALKTSGRKSMNASVISWHLVEDVLGWAAVLVGAVVIKMTDWWWIDASLAIGISAFILVNILRRVWRIGRLFLQVAPEGIDVDALRDDILAIDGVTDVHHLHIWSLDGEHHVVTVHARVSAEDLVKDAKTEIRSRLRSIESEHVTVEIEIGGADCSLGTSPQED